MLIHQTPQIGGTRIAWVVQWQRFGAPKIHDQAAHPGAAPHGTPFGQAADKASCGGSSANGQQRDSVHRYSITAHTFLLVLRPLRPTNGCSHVGYVLRLFSLDLFPPWKTCSSTHHQPQYGSIPFSRPLGW